MRYYLSRTTFAILHRMFQLIAPWKKWRATRTRSCWATKPWIVHPELYSTSLCAHVCIMVCSLFVLRMQIGHCDYSILGSKSTPVVVLLPVVISNGLRAARSVLHAWVQLPIRPTTTVSCISSLHAYSYITQSGRSVKTKNAKNTKKITDS